MNPFMTQYESNFISAARSGGSGTILLCALISIVQNPGDPENIRFSPTIYIIIFGVILILPIIAYNVIVRKKLGLKVNEDSSAGPKGEREIDSIEMSSVSEHSKSQLNPLTAEINCESNANSPEKGRISLNNSDSIGDSSGGHIEKFLKTIGSLFPDYMQPYIVKLLPYMATVIWVDFNTWGWMSALLPYSMEYSKYNGEGIPKLLYFFYFFQKCYVYNCSCVYNISIDEFKQGVSIFQLHIKLVAHVCY